MSGDGRMTIGEALALAVRRHQSGDLAGAESLYRQILDVAPDCSDALNLMGVVLLQYGRAAEGAELIAEAVRISPDFAEAHNNLGNACRDLGQHVRAEARYRTALALSPAYTCARRNLGDALQAQGRPTEAAACHRRVLAAEPLAADTRCNLGNALHAAGRNADAVTVYRTAISLRPEFGAAWGNLGITLHDDGRGREALPALIRARRLCCDDFEPTLAFAETLRRLGQESTAAWRACLVLAPADKRVATGLMRSAFETSQDGAAVWLRRLARLEGREPGEVRSLRPSSVAAWCGRSGLPYRTILPERRVDTTIAGTYAGPVTYRLPETYFALVEEATVIPSNHAVAVGAGTLLLDGLHAYSRASLTALPHYRHEASDGRILSEWPIVGERIEEPSILFGGDGNFSHGVLDWTSRLLAIEGQPEAAGLPLLVSPRLRPAIVELLELLGMPRDRLRPIHAEKATLCRSLWLPSLTHAFQKPAPEYLAWLRRLLPAAASPKRRFYLGRSSSAHRALTNEKAVLAALAPFRIEPFVPEGITLARQIELLAEAEFIVMVAGGGSAAIAFAPASAAVLELTHSRCVLPQYGTLAALLGQRYAQVIGEPVANRGALTFDWDFRIDPEDAARAASSLFS